MKTRGLILICI